eukprot:338201_1
MSPDAYHVRSRNQIALSRIYFEYHPNELLQHFLQSDFAKHVCIYYAILWGEDNATILSAAFGIVVSGSSVSKWLRFGKELNDDDPKIMMMKGALDVVYDMIGKRGINNITENEIATQIQFLCAHFRAAMHMDPPTLDTSSYMIGHNEYTTIHTRTRKIKLQEAQNSDETKQFKSNIQYIKKLHSGMAIVYQQQLCDAAADFLFKHYFAITCPYNNCTKVVTDINGIDTMKCELNAKFAAASGWVDFQSVDHGGGYFLDTKYVNNKIGPAIAPYENSSIYSVFKSPKQITDQLLQMYSSTGWMSSEKLVATLRLGEAPTTAIIRTIDSSVAVEDPPLIQPAQIMRSSSHQTHAMDNDCYYLTQFHVDNADNEENKNNDDAVNDDEANDNAANDNSDNSNDIEMHNSNDNSDTDVESIIESLTLFNESMLENIEYGNTKYFETYCKLGVMYSKIVRTQGFNPRDIWEGEYDMELKQCIDDMDVVNMDTNELIGKYDSECEDVLAELLIAVDKCDAHKNVVVMIRKINCMQICILLRARGHVSYGRNNNKVSHLHTKTQKQIRRMFDFVDYVVEMDFPSLFFIKWTVQTAITHKKPVMAGFIEFVNGHIAYIDRIGSNELHSAFEVCTPNELTKWALFKSDINTFNL